MEVHRKRRAVSTSGSQSNGQPIVLQYSVIIHAQALLRMTASTDIYIVYWLCITIPDLQHENCPAAIGGLIALV